MKTTQDYKKITPYLVAELKDRQTLVHHLAKNPTPVKKLASEYPDYLKCIDSFLLGSGGGNYTRTPDHIILGMEIFMAIVDSTQTSVSKKSKG